jgi:hypothetical protein
MLPLSAVKQALSVEGMSVPLNGQLKSVDHFTGHYHDERSHQGLGNDLIDGAETQGVGVVVTSERLGVGCSNTITGGRREGRPIEISDSTKL